MSVVLDADRITRSLTRIAHEILERNRGVDELAFVGIRTRGVPIARRIARAIHQIAHHEVPTGALDITTGVIVLEALARVNRELGTATAVITHNAAIAGMADRVVRLADGVVAGIERNTHKVAPQALQW